MADKTFEVVDFQTVRVTQPVAELVNLDDLKGNIARIQADCQQRLLAGATLQAKLDEILANVTLPPNPGGN